jgi:hypothetical protein
MSEPAAEESEQSTKQDIAVPTAGIDPLNAVIRGLYARDPTPTKYKDLATQIKPPIGETVVSSALAVAKALGLAEVTKGAGRGAYVLTTEGKQYGRHLQSNNDAGRETMLRQQILSSPKWKEIVFFLKSNVAQTVKTTDLSNHVANRLNTTWQARALENYGANYSSILAAAGLATYSGGKITPLQIVESADIGGNANNEDGKKPEDQESEDRQSTLQPLAPQKVGIQMPITINVSVDAKDSEAVKNLILLIKAVKGEDSSSLT